MASLLDDWTVNEDATQGTRLTYSTEALKKIGAQCQITSTTSAPLDFPLVAQADVLVHVDPDYHLCARARLSPSDHHSNGPTGSGRLNAVNGKTAVRNGKLPSNSSQKNHVPNRVDRPQLSQSTNVDKPMLAKQAPAPYQSTQFVPTPAEIEKDFAKWRRDVPRDDEPTYRSLGRGLARFYQDAFRFVQAHPGMMQDVISMLGREGGLRRINELISSLESSSTYKREIVREQVLPFFRAISFERVVASAVLEAPLGKIHQFLYGPNGRRAEALFTDILDVLKNLELQPLVSVEDSMIAEIYETSVMVLLKMVQANGDALINESIHRLVDRMSGILVPTELRAKKYLARISRILDMDKEMPKAGGANSNAQLMYRPNFHVVEDLPGNLSEHGPRHDNDSSSIRDIKIMPTSQEIQSTREEYLPTRDPSTWHVPGLRGLLDRQFRLLREDTVGQLRDAVCDELNRMQSPESVRKVRGRQGLRTHTYQNVQFRDVVCHHREGLRFTIDFDQPEAIRGNPKKSVRTEWWTASRRLDLDALVCLLDSNGSAIFCYVISKRKGNLKKGVPFSVKAAIEEKIEDQAQDSMRASVLLGLVQNDAASVRTLLARFQGSSLFKQESLVEFPGVLLPSFQSTLLALQDMAKTLDLPFSELIAPEDAAEFNKDSSRPIVSPPAYALATGFKFDLKSVLKNESKDLFLSLHDSFDFESLVENTTLDHAQAHALVEALTRSIALVQGPPGTGKSYTGVSLIKVLLDNRVKAKIGPIICVCYTNHALDQLLEQLLHSGVTAIVRLGAQSKSELLRQFNLAEIARNTRTTKNEGKRHRETDARLSADAKEVNDSLGALRQAKQWTTLKEFLNNKYPEHHDEFFSAEEENWQTVRYRPEQIISNWLKGNDQPDLSSTYSHPPSSDQPVKSRSLDELRYVQLRGMTVAERHGLWNAWSAEMIDELQGEVLNSLALYEDDKAEFEKVRKDLNLRCLQNAHIVGVTTTGLAKNLDLLRRLPSKVIICEEAGEVLEAHCLTTLLPSIEHAVLIGDHMQLRPRIQNWELNSENPRGEQYSLDVSLFERLVASPIPSVQLPHSTLEIQRRMDPSISQLIRKTIYPHLKDSHAVCNYPPVAGMARRLFWYHHEQHEAAPEPDKLLVSQYNEYEIEFVAALVSHLVKQGVYGTGDIAVLTPYLGQLMRLRRRLSASHEITMGERDQEELLQAGLDDDEAGEKASKPKSTRSTLLKALRVSTVDNFQGEEAKVVVISLVRSNKEKNCGFLKTFNRINVLLSRAKHGMYIIGNAKTAYGVQMWADVINILRKENNFGGSLELSCPRHPETPIYVTHPDDFHEQAPEGMSHFLY
ncbi:MAG: hypothetical protein M1820_001326 [Bogoriella megaspora]|nr:MAG: hypothetical protein M1820_001326 [Bogoriella megaspora]